MESKIAKLREGERRMNDSFQGQHREEDMKRHWSKGAKFQSYKLSKPHQQQDTSSSQHCLVYSAFANLC